MPKKGIQINHPIIKDSLMFLVSIDGNPITQSTNSDLFSKSVRDS